MYPCSPSRTDSEVLERELAATEAHALKLTMQKEARRQQAEAQRRVAEFEKGLQVPQNPIEKRQLEDLSAKQQQHLLGDDDRRCGCGVAWCCMQAELETKVMGLMEEKDSRVAEAELLRRDLQARIEELQAMVNQLDHKARRPDPNPPNKHTHGHTHTHTVTHTHTHTHTHTYTRSHTHNLRLRPKLP